MLDLPKAFCNIFCKYPSILLILIVLFIFFCTTEHQHCYLFSRLSNSNQSCDMLVSYQSKDVLTYYIMTNRFLFWSSKFEKMKHCTHVLIIPRICCIMQFCKGQKQGHSQTMILIRKTKDQTYIFKCKERNDYDNTDFLQIWVKQKLNSCNFQLDLLLNFL